MTRIALDWIIQGTPFDQLFEQTAEGQYTREFTLEHLVLVMLDVVCGHHPSTRSAFRDRQLELIASLSAFYGKLNRMELAVTEEVVRQTARRSRELIAAAGGLLPEPIPGYAARILDGNVLAGTDHRLIPTRTTWSACLPGKSLAIYEPASGLIIDVVLEENAHTQERALLDEIVVQRRRAVDRSIATSASAPSCSASSGPGRSSWCGGTHRPCRSSRWGRVRSQGRCPTGKVFEQAILVDDPEAAGVRHRLRRIVLELDEPTRDGETEIVLVTNLPEEVSAIDCCAGLPGSLADRGSFPGADRPAALRDPLVELSAGGAVRLRDVGGGRQRAGGVEGEPAGGARRRRWPGRSRTTRW